MTTAPVISSYVGCWVESNYVVPGGYKVGTDHGKDVYIIRAPFRGALLPGKYVHNHGTFVPWGGQEHRVSNFEMLCHSQLKWVNCYGSMVPQNAFVGGNSEDGEQLYIGKCLHNGHTVVGKVQRSHGVLYYPWNGCEHKTKTFQILVV